MKALSTILYNTTHRPKEIIFEKPSVKFFQKIFILYWFFAILGHYIESAWAQYNQVFNGQAPWKLIIPTVTPAAAPYGIGAVIIYLVVWPLVKSRRINPIGVLILTIIIAAIVEYICAAIIVIIAGHNIFWNYSHNPFNLNGYICLESVTQFGIVATIVTYSLFPSIEKIMKKLNNSQFNLIFWTLFITYSLDLIYATLK